MCYFSAACFICVQSVFKGHIEEVKDQNTAKAKIMKKNLRLPET